MNRSSSPLASFVLQLQIHLLTKQNYNVNMTQHTHKEVKFNVTVQNSFSMFALHRYIYYMQHFTLKHSSSDTVQFPSQMQHFEGTLRNLCPTPLAQPQLATPLLLTMQNSVNSLWIYFSLPVSTSGQAHKFPHAVISFPGACGAPNTKGWIRPPTPLPQGDTVTNACTTLPLTGCYSTPTRPGYSWQRHVRHLPSKSSV